MKQNLTWGAVFTAPREEKRAAKPQMSRRDAISFLRAVTGLEPDTIGSVPPAVQSVVPYPSDGPGMITLQRTPHPIRALREEGIIGVT